VRGERKSIQIASPKGNKVASIDLGINVLASVVLNDGTWLLYKGVRAKEDYFYLQKEIAEYNLSRTRQETSVNMKLKKNLTERRGGCSRN